MPKKLFAFGTDRQTNCKKTYRRKIATVCFFTLLSKFSIYLQKYQSLQGINFPMMPPTIAGRIHAKPYTPKGRDFTKPVGTP